MQKPFLTDSHFRKMSNNYVWNFVLEIHIATVPNISGKVIGGGRPWKSTSRHCCYAASGHVSGTGKGHPHPTNPQHSASHITFHKCRKHLYRLSNGSHMGMHVFCCISRAPGDGTSCSFVMCIREANPVIKHYGFVLLPQHQANSMQYTKRPWNKWEAGWQQCLVSFASRVLPSALLWEQCMFSTDG